MADFEKRNENLDMSIEKEKNAERFQPVVSYLQLFSERVKAYRVEIIRHIGYVSDTESGLHVSNVNLGGACAHIVYDIYGKLLLHLALLHLIDKVSELFRLFGAQFCKTYDAHVDAGKIPIGTCYSVKEVSYNLCLIDLSAHN